MQIQTETEVAIIPLSAIATSELNPRKYFDTNKMNELIASVRAVGILQPILVRNTEEGYAIVAGERRYRAAKEAGLSDIPAIIKEMSDDDVSKAALIENTVREDMSIAEEAEAAQRILNMTNGDREEAAACLGWPLSKFNRRIALLYLIPEGMEALMKKEILVGHGELLAVIPPDKQKKALETIIEHKLTVQQVKDLLIKVSTNFKDAIFAVAGCNYCHHNSSQQSSLFVDSIGEGYCTNSDCYKGKTVARLEAIKTELSEEVQTVKIIEIGENSFSKLAAEGSLGVGEEQYAACGSCVNFGVTVSNLPGEVGKIEYSICFDSVCQQKKVAARIKAEKEKANAAKAENKTSDAKERNSADPTSETKNKEPKIAGISQRVKDYRRKVWNVAVKKELRQQEAKAKHFLLDLLLTGDGGKVNSTELGELYKRITGESLPGGINFEGLLAITSNIDPSKIDLIYLAAAISAVEALAEKRFNELLSYLDTDLGKHWKIEEEFLTMLTKSELEGVCVSVGIDGLIPDFKKVMAGKKDEVIKAILAVSGNADGKVPTILNMP